jgi:hypothetical protein
MRKNLIALGVTAFVGSLGMIGSASANVFADNGAATVSPTNATASRLTNGGTGHQLLVPYFNVQNGNATLINIVNTDVTNGKAVKVRFRGGSNSDDVFDFQLFLSPGDVWTANLSKSADGRTMLTTTDKSCTIPSGVGKDNGGPNSLFVTARLPQTLTGDAMARETREGYVEIFNMADIPARLPNADGSVSATANPLFTATKHVAGTPPCTVATMNSLANDPGSLVDAYALGFRAPTTGLFGNYAIVNVPKAGTATGEMVAITAVDPVTDFPRRGNIVFFPQTPVGVPATTADRFTADPSLRSTAGVLPGNVSNGAGAPYAGALPIIAAAMFDLPDLTTPYLLLAAYPPAQIDPINYLINLQIPLATTAVMNEYLTDPNINAFTDWTFSQPTRRYGVAPDYRALNAGTGPVTRAFSVFTAAIPHPFYSAANTAVSGFQICVSTSGVTFFDREENTAVGTSFVISPNPPAAVFRLCGETSVLTFNSTGASVLGAEIARTNFSTGTFRDGWAGVGTPGAIGAGLPVVGRTFVNASTGTLNVGGSWEHRYLPLEP